MEQIQLLSNIQILAGEVLLDNRKSKPVKQLDNQVSIHNCKRR